MLVKSWLSSIINSIVLAIRMRPNRKIRRRRASRTRSLRRMLAAAALTPLLVASTNGDEPLFPGLQFPAGDSPTSVTTGDFNGDGVTDLATANRIPTTCRCCWAWVTELSRPRQPIAAGDTSQVRNNGRL